MSVYDTLKALGISLYGELFGPSGAHARCAFGVAQVPFGSCVKGDLVAEVRR